MLTQSSIRVVRAAVVLSAVLTCASVPAFSQSFNYRTGFEPPVFQPGHLNGQDGWGNPQNTAFITDRSPITGLQSIGVNGSNLSFSGNGLVGTRFGRLAFYDPLAEHTPVIDVSVEARLIGPSTDSGQGPSDDLLSANLDFMGIDSGSNPVFLGTLALSTSGEVWVFGNRSQDAYAAGIPIKLSDSHRLKIRADFSTRRVQFYVDGKRVEFVSNGKRRATLPFDPASPPATFAGGFTSFFAVDDPELIDPTRYRARFDNYSVTALKPVAVDIRPASCPNRLNVDKSHVLPVAVLGSKQIDVSEIDPTTLRLVFGQGQKKQIAPSRWEIRDAATPYRPYLGKVSTSDCTDSGPDGYDDLMVRFDLAALADYLHATKNRTVKVLSITGKQKQEFGGGAITGEDTLLIINKK